jgi:hypothetical protein
MSHKKLCWSAYRFIRPVAVCSVVSHKDAYPKKPVSLIAPETWPQVKNVVLPANCFNVTWISRIRLKAFAQPAEHFVEPIRFGQRGSGIAGTGDHQKTWARKSGYSPQG